MMSALKVSGGRTSRGFRLLFFLSVTALFSCQRHGTEPAGSYDYMLLQRSGGGDLAFTVSPAAVPEMYRIDVVHREFRDTTIHLVVAGSETYSRAFVALGVALKGQAPITGDFKQSSLPTGTWVRVYMVKGNERDEVTNTQLRGLLLPFESLVRGYL